jgi:putative transposase
MGRQLRRELPDGIFHASARGTGRIAIVRDNLDCDAFAWLLERVARRWEWALHAFCLMPNHYHLVLETSVARLSKGMHALNGLYARRFNERHLRSGHLFQERFDARVIESDEYLESACRYVLDNPVRAGLAGSGEPWPWSGTSRFEP